MSKSKPVIRAATPMDSVNITRLIRAGWRDTPAVAVAEMDDNRLLEYVTMTLKHCFCVVADKEGRLLGSIALVPIRLPWAAPNMVVLAEGWFAVMATYRQREVPDLLLDAVDTFLDKGNHCALLGSNVLAPADLSDVMTNRPCYVPSRMSFLRVPNTHVDAQGRPIMPPKAVAT